MKIKNRSLPILLVIEAVVLITVIILSVLSSVKKSVVEDNDAKKEYITEASTSEISQNTDTSQENPNEKDKPMEFSQEIEDKYNSMTMEQRVAQLIITTPEALTGVQTATRAGESTRQAIVECPVGGLIYSDKNFISKEQTSEMVKNVQIYMNDTIGVDSFVIVDSSNENLEGVSYLSKADLGSEGLKIVSVSNSQDAINQLVDNANMIEIDEELRTIYMAMVSAASEGIVSEEIIHDRVCSVLKMKEK